MSQVFLRNLHFASFSTQLKNVPERLLQNVLTGCKGSKALSRLLKHERLNRCFENAKLGNADLINSFQMEMQHPKTINYSLAKPFRDGGVIPFGSICLDVSALRRSIFIGLCAASTFLATTDVALALVAVKGV